MQARLSKKEERTILRNAAQRDVMEDVPWPREDGSLTKPFEPFLQMHKNLPYIPVDSPEIRAEKVLRAHGGAWTQEAKEALRDECSITARNWVLYNHEVLASMTAFLRH